FFTAAAMAGAQSSSRAIVRITAKDSTGAPVPGAELTVTRGLHNVVAHGTTDDTGQGILSVDLKDSTDLQVTMRKIGYARGDRFFDAGPRDTTNVTVTVARARTAELAPVTVTAKANLRYASYHLDADDIEKSDIPLDDGWDVVKRLRPDMLTGRGGCGTGAQEVWVNGKRIRLTLRPTGMVAARARVGAPLRARFGYVPVTVMSEIAPEHIQEITYKDCFDQVAQVGATNALFVVLKPGVVYQQDVGSFVIETSDRGPSKP
ncbi:MAG: carboxypeptidase-like regulatory domain-containing protein, partial [bacterium]